MLADAKAVRVRSPARCCVCAVKRKAGRAALSIVKAVDPAAVTVLPASDAPDAVIKAKPANRGQFSGKPGPGRPKGGSNAQTIQLKDMILQALHGEGGVRYLRKQAKQNPAAFMALISKVLPLDIGAGLLAIGMPVIKLEAPTVPAIDPPMQAPCQSDAPSSPMAIEAARSLAGDASHSPPQPPSESAA